MDRGKDTFNLKKLPKIIKYLVMVLIIGIICIVGIKISSKFSHREDIVQFGFKDVGFLVTQEWYGRIVEDSKEDRKFFNLFKIPGTESRQLFSIDVIVTAGIDFENIEYKINNKKETITVKLPHARLDKTTSDDDSMVIYIDSESWFSRINLEENNEARIAIKDKAEKIALDQGILTKAEANAEKLITNMIKSNGECLNNKCKDFKIDFKYE